MKTAGRKRYIFIPKVREVHNRETESLIGKNVTASPGETSFSEKNPLVENPLPPQGIRLKMSEYF